MNALVATFQGEHYAEMGAIVERMVDLTGVPLGFEKACAVAQAIDALAPDVVLLSHCALAHYSLPLVHPEIKPVAILHADVPLFYRTAFRFPEFVFRWVCPSRRLVEGCRERLPVRYHDRIRLVPHGVETNPFGVVGKPPVEGTPVILFVGNLGVNKGAHLLPEIFQRVAQEVPGTHFEVLGKGELEGRLRGEFERRALAVTMRGHVQHEEVLHTMRDAHLLVLPSGGEGFGLVTIEAMHAGVVPVVSRLEGTTDDIIRHGQTGVLVAPTDIKGYVAALVSLAREPARWTAMSQAAIQDARERFSLELMVKRYEALFTEPDDRQAHATMGPLAWRVRSIREHYRGRWRRA